MAKVPYIIDDILGQVCAALGVSGYQLLGGHYAFALDAHQTVYDTVTEMLNAMYEDNDSSNDATADLYFGMLDSEEHDYGVFYWSTEKATWY